MRAVPRSPLPGLALDRITALGLRRAARDRAALLETATRQLRAIARLRALTPPGVTVHEYLARQGMTPLLCDALRLRPAGWPRLGHPLAAERRLRRLVAPEVTLEALLDVLERAAQHAKRGATEPA